jgi:tetratricopeptide (TPR) repeat protein
MSSQRLSRKEIKHDVRDDAFRHSVEVGYDYVRDHRRNLVVAIAAAVVLIGGLAAWRTWSVRREAAASDLLGRAIAAYDAPIAATDAKPDDLVEPSFPTEAARIARAKELFTKLDVDFPRTGAAAVAQVYEGRIHLQEGDAAGARKSWEAFLDRHPDHLLASAVRLSLLELDRREGKAEQIVQRLRADLDRDDKPLPEDVMLYQLGITLEQLKRGQEAKEVFQRVVDEYPDSPFASKAMQKNRDLAGPGGVG